VTVDDATRPAYAERLPDARRESATGFLKPALAFHATNCALVRRLPDNGTCYRSRVLRRVARDNGHWCTQPYHPQTNGKAAAFVKIRQNRWAYKRPYDSTAERIATLPASLTYYNGYEPREDLNGNTPLGRLRTSTTA
jgi:transposase InsO family protein